MGRYLQLCQRLSLILHFQLPSQAPQVRLVPATYLYRILCLHPRPRSLLELTTAQLILVHFSPSVLHHLTLLAITFARSDATSTNNIQVISTWPDSRGQSLKAPTTLAYSAENKPKLTADQWGFQVDPNLQSYTWTKLLLDKHAQPAKFDDPLLRDRHGDGLLRLPEHKSAQDVVEDFLRELYVFTVTELERHFDREVFRRMAMKCWITMPAVWSDEAQAATRDAARGAGFGSRANDTVFMIWEPEAAFLTAIAPHLVTSAIDPIQVCL